MGHAVLSPSGAGRWLACTPSARIEQRFPDRTSSAAEEGTLAHELGETKLRLKTKEIKKAEYNKIIEVITSNSMYSEAMNEYVDGYVTYVWEQFNAAKKSNKDAVIMVEAKLDMTEYVPEGYGTGDAVVISDGVLNIIDLKYGKGVPVSADCNKQMMLYALGALADFDMLFDITRVRMTIYQPRLDNVSVFEMGVDELKQWANSILAPRARQAFDGAGEFVAGDHCRFCRAKAQCKALADYNLAVIKKNELRDSALLADADIEEVLGMADAVRKWLAAVEEFAFEQALDGKKWDSYKLVEGRSNRVYADAEAVVDTLLLEGFTEENLYEKKLLGITAMEKVVGKKLFGDVLSPYIIKPQGKPTLVPRGDKREEWHAADSAAEDFKDIDINQ